jgi:hypothetical protein
MKPDPPPSFHIGINQGETLFPFFSKKLNIKPSKQAMLLAHPRDEGWLHIILRPLYTNIAALGSIILNSYKNINVPSMRFNKTTYLG